MDLEEQAEHARVGRPGGQDPDCLGGARLAQRRQQPGDSPLIAGAEGLAGVDGQLAAGVTG